MLRRQFQKQVVAWIVVVAEPSCFEAVIVSGSLLQLLGHFHPSDEHRTITASNAVLYSCRTYGCGHQEDRVIVRYSDTFGARRPPSSQALPSDQVFHEKPNRLRICPVTRLQSHKDPVGSGRRSYRQIRATPLVQWQNIRDQC
jgi:hypothetical protein